MTDLLCSLKNLDDQQNEKIEVPRIKCIKKISKILYLINQKLKLVSFGITNDNLSNKTIFH